MGYQKMVAPDENYLQGYEYETLINALKVSVFKCLLDDDFTVIWCNDYFIGSTGYTQEEYAQRYHYNIRKYFSGMADEYRAIGAAVMGAYQRGEPGFKCVSRMPHKSGRPVWIKVVGTFTAEKQDGVPVLYVVYTDITDVVEQQELRKKLEERSEMLRTALESAEEANMAKSDFLSRMSHDIRTPLNAIIGMTEIADAHLDNPQKVHDCHKKIAVSSQHLLGLINDVLDMSKIESGKMTISEDVLSLPELLETVVSIIQPDIKAKRQRFSVRPRQITTESVYSDGLRLRQIFINILSNASKFTPEGGTITFDIEALEAQEEGRVRLCFSISDTGMGMEPEFMTHIFDVFAREYDSRVDKAPGSGLGMAITKKIVDMLGGSIEVESTPGMGSTFRVILPLRVAETPAETIDFKGCRILLADDDDLVCAYAADVFEDLGLENDCVNSGATAVERVLESRARQKDYDAVILDWKMPGLSGLQTARKIREAVGDAVPILIATAYDWEEIEEEARSVGIAGFLQKPLFRSTLCGGLRKYLLGRDELREETGSPKHFDFTGKRFLLAEDNELNGEIAVELLAATGARIDWVRDGAQCVDRFAKSPEGCYDLVFMDVRMPVMDGYAAAKAIRKLNRGDAPTVQIWAMTADAFVEDIEAAKASGMNGHFSKPLDIRLISREISRVLG